MLQPGTVPHRLPGERPHADGAPGGSDRRQRPIRRRVFASGYEYCEAMRRGYEDWEFWLRTCALGPFRAAPLKKQVFAYRKWGYSMLSATDHDEQLADIRRRHAALKIWSPRVES